jgi:hypothetical protein
MKHNTKIAIASFFIWLVTWVAVTAIFLILTLTTAIVFAPIAFLICIGGLFGMPVFVKVIKDHLKSKFSPPVV